MSTISRFFSRVAIALTFLAASPAFAADAATSPSTKPAAIKPTTEQAAVIKKIYAQPIDEPYPKYDTHLTNRDGTPNENFGKLDQNFMKQHEAFLKRGKVGPIGLLFLGNSITYGWLISARKLWGDRYGKFDAADFGISGDGTEHVLWRIANGELDGISPRVVVLLIGTNNGAYQADQITAADTRIVQQIHEKLPDAKVLLLGIFPRGVDPSKDKNVAEIRAKFKTVNAALAKLDDGTKTRFLDIGDKFLTPDGVITPDIMPDGLHPNAKGYQIWADAMQPLLDEMMK